MKIIFVFALLFSVTAFAQWEPELTCQLTQDLPEGAIYGLPKVPAHSTIGFYKYSESACGEIMVVSNDGLTPLVKDQICNLLWINTPTHGVAFRFMNSYGDLALPDIQYVITIGQAQNGQTYSGALFKAAKTNPNYSPVSDGLECSSRYFGN